MRFNMDLLKQPKAFWVLAFGELWSTFSYYGTQTILALYFLHVFKLTQRDSYLLYGAYAAFAYSLPILGGIVGDRWLGSKNAAITGGILNIASNFMLMSFSHYLFCVGLATSLVGAGLYKSNVINLVGALYEDGSLKKEQGFTLLYLCINIGGVLGPLLYGLVVYSIGWNFGFLGSALSILISVIWFIRNQHVFEQNKNSIPLKTHVKMFLYVSILAFCLFLSLPFYIPTMINILVFILFSVGIIYLMGAIIKYKGKERSRLLALLLISFFGMFYFAAGLQIGTTITLFIQSNIQQGTIQTHLPASIFSTLYPFFVLLLAPFFTYLWSTLKIKGITINTPSKLALGMTLAALGISVFALVSLSHFVIIGIVIGILLLSAGELALAPAIYTTISDLSPEGMKSTMMGCWLLFIAFGGYLSSVLASNAHFMTRIISFYQSEYFNQFIFIAGFTFFILLILIAAIPKLLKMME